MKKNKRATGEKLHVVWIVTEGNDPLVCGDGEFGVAINGVPYLYYKWPEPDPKTAEGVKFRPITKREFGEVIRREQLRPNDLR